MMHMGSQTEARQTEEAVVLTPDLTVAEIMERWPATIAVFLAYRMACVGCFMAPFDTLAEAAGNYRLDVDELLRALQARIEAKAET